MMKTVQPHDMLTHKNLRELAAVEENVCVSLYFPTHPSAPESHQDPVRLRNLLDGVEGQLLKREDLRRPDVERLLKPAREMIGDEFFWTHQSDGLAVFLTDGAHHAFRLPAPFDQTIEVGEHFLVTPIISLLRPGQSFYLLAVSQNSCRLFRGNQFQVEEIESEDLPKDLESALGWWRERELNFHAQRRGQADAAIFHGHEEDAKEIDLTAYLRKVVEPLKSMLYNQPDVLVFAGVEEMFPIFRDVYGEKGLISEHVIGNPDKLSARQLHQRAWPLVEGHNRRQIDKIWKNYHAARNLDRASNALAMIVPACRDGLVETLLLADGARLSGTFDAETGQIRLGRDGAHTVDVLNLAAVFALRTGANVLAVPPSGIPEKASAAAILRGPTSAVATPGVNP